MGYRDTRDTWDDGGLECNEGGILQNFKWFEAGSGRRRAAARRGRGAWEAQGLKRFLKFQMGRGGRPEVLRRRAAVHFVHAPLALDSV